MSYASSWIYLFIYLFIYLLLFFFRIFFLSIAFFFLIFIYFWLCWVFVSVRGLSLVAASGGHSSSWCAGLSLSRPLLLQSTGSSRAGSVIVAQGPSCSVAFGILPDQGSNPCPLAGRLSTTAPPGKPVWVFFNKFFQSFLQIIGKWSSDFFLWNLRMNLALCN